MSRQHGSTIRCPECHGTGTVTITEPQSDKCPGDVPTVMCLLCGDWLEVLPDGRGFPPDIAKRKLAKKCLAAGHDSEPQYRAGVRFGPRAGGQS